MDVMVPQSNCAWAMLSGSSNTKQPPSMATPVRTRTHRRHATIARSATSTSALSLPAAPPPPRTHAILPPAHSISSSSPSSLRTHWTHSRPFPHTLSTAAAARAPSPWDAWGSDSDDAEDDLLAQLAAAQSRSQQAASSLPATSPTQQQQPSKPGATQGASPTRPLQPRPGAPSSSTANHSHLLLPFGSAATQATVGSTFVQGLQAPLKPQLKGRQRSKPPKGSLFPTTDPLIDGAYSGTHCSAVRANNGMPYTRSLKDFNSLRHRPFSFTKKLQDNMLAARMKVPTPIQRRAMPAIARGRDVLATAPTGTGKTAAYLLPILGSLMRTTRDGLSRNKAYPAAVVLVPTHELVMQVYEECSALIKATHLRAVALHGGQPMVQEVLAMRKGMNGGGADILITTPGRLLDHVERRRSVRLDRLAHIVMDEADKLLDLGFEPEIKRLLSKPQLPLPDMRQTILFCATLPPEVKDLAAKLLKPNFVHITAGSSTGVPSIVTQNIILMEHHPQQQHEHPYTNATPPNPLPLSANTTTITSDPQQPPTPTAHSPSTPPSTLTHESSTSTPPHSPSLSSLSPSPPDTVAAASAATDASDAATQGAGMSAETVGALNSAAPTAEGHTANAASGAAAPQATHITAASASFNAPSPTPGVAAPISMGASKSSVAGTSPGTLVWANKLHLLARQVAANRGLTLVFTNTIVQATKVYTSLAELSHSVSLLHSNMPQVSRDESIQCFRYGVTPIMVATSVAARGLDVPDITHVINFDMPYDILEYVYRIGRTGRAGRPGTATTFFTLPQDSWIAQDIVGIMRGVRQEPPPWLTALAQQQQQQQQQQEGEGSSANTTHTATPAQPSGAGTPQRQQQQQQRKQQQGEGAHTDVGAGAGASHSETSMSPYAPRPGGLIMESGDWSDVPLNVGVRSTDIDSEIVGGVDGGMSRSLASVDDSGVGNLSAAGAAANGVSSSGGSSDSDSSSSDGESAHSEESSEDGRRASMLRAARGKPLPQRPEPFNRYVSTAWGASPQLAAVLDPWQQQDLQRRLNARNKRQQEWLQQATSEAEAQGLGEQGAESGVLRQGAKADGQHGAGVGQDKRVNSSSSSTSSSSSNSTSSSITSIDDSQLVRQWYTIIQKGWARLPSRGSAQRSLAQKGAPASEQQKRLMPASPGAERNGRGPVSSSASSRTDGEGNSSPGKGGLGGSGRRQVRVRVKRQ